MQQPLPARRLATRLSRCGAAAFALAAVNAPPAAAQTGSVPDARIAAPLPPVALGQTNILSGEGAPGASLEVLFVGAAANRLTDPGGGRVPGRNRQRVAAVIVHPIYMAATTFAGGHPGVEAIVPISSIDNDFAARGGSHTGLGDITLTPFIQWSPAKPRAGSVSARFGLQATAPTGDRSLRRNVNTGQGAWQLSPYLTSTWRIDRTMEISALGIYGRSWSATGVPGGDRNASVRPGQVAVLNLSTSWELGRHVRAGIGGYVLRQLTAPRFDDEPIPGRRERIHGIGPVTRWEHRRLLISAAAFGEFGGRNRPEGATMNLRVQWLM